MSATKHTPGPWKLSDPRYIRHDGNLELRLDIIAANKRPVVTLVFDRSRSIGEERLTADIGAMLAAPEMLSALEKCVPERYGRLP